MGACARRSGWAHCSSLVFSSSLFVLRTHDITRSGTCGLQKSGFGEQIRCLTALAKPTPLRSRLGSMQGLQSGCFSLQDPAVHKKVRSAPLSDIARTRRRFGFSAGTEAAPITGAPAAHVFTFTRAEPRGLHG